MINFWLQDEQIIGSYKDLRLPKSLLTISSF